MSAGRPTGSGWKHISGKLMMIEIYENEVVGTNSGNAIYKCPVSGVAAPKTNRPNKKSSKSKGRNIMKQKFIPKIVVVKEFHFCSYIFQIMHMHFRCHMKAFEAGKC